MSEHAPVIQGMGWVTPLGTDLGDVWRRVQAGERGLSQPLENPETGRIHRYMPVPPTLVAAAGRLPRLRRASPISCFAVAAGLAAMADAGLSAPVAPEVAARTAVVFAISSGGVVYTRRFYEQIVKTGAHGASPLLFPETVYNAPASHLAAMLGIDGASYTLVGDGSVGLSALQFAGQLLRMGEVDRCVVVGAEETDWVLCQGYADWRLLTRSGEVELYAARPRGAMLAEGGAAIVLGLEGAARARIVVQHAGRAFANRREMAHAYDKVCLEMAAPAGVVIGSANGTWLDTIEARSVGQHFPGAGLFSIKGALGEAIGAGGLMSTIAGVMTLEAGAEDVLVIGAGWNMQVGALRLAGEGCRQ